MDDVGTVNVESKTHFTSVQI